MRARSSGGYDWTDPDDMDPPPSADVDAARLLDNLLDDIGRNTTLADSIRVVVAAIRAERRLDVERLVRAIADHCHEGKHEGAPIFLRHKHLAPFLVDTCGAAVAAEYARLAKDAERPERTWQEDIEEFTR